MLAQSLIHLTPIPHPICLEQVQISYICIYMLRQPEDKNRKQKQLPSKNNSNNNIIIF